MIIKVDRKDQHIPDVAKEKEKKNRQLKIRRNNLSTVDRRTVRISNMCKSLRAWKDAMKVQDTREISRDMKMKKTHLYFLLL